MHLRRTKWHQPGAITHPEDAGDLEAKSPANQSSMKAGHNIFWTCPASEAPSGAGEKMFFISLVNFLSVSHKSLKQSTHLATLYHSQHEGFLVAQLVKNPPAMWKTWLQFLGQEDPLEKGKATHSNILAWRISWII